jgi:hypothetical protein
MKPWVVQFLTARGDQNISIEELGRDLQTPVFCYRRLADFFYHDLDERIKTLFGVFLANLEPEVFCKLQGTPNLRIHGIKRIGQVRRVNQSPEHPSLPIEIVEFEYYWEMTDSEVIGDIAHEMSHVYLAHNDQVLCGLNLVLEAEADVLVEDWGFGFELEKVRQFLKERSQNNGKVRRDF